MARRSRRSPKMSELLRRPPNHRGPAADSTELAYREALAKLKYLLAESYTPTQSAVFRSNKPTTSAVLLTAEREDESKRQENYIDQLEKEGQLYREELNRVLDRIREAGEVKPPAGPLSEEDESDREYREERRGGPRGGGGDIVLSSRISELEAQLTQARLQLRKAQDEAAYLKAHSKPISPPVSQQTIHQLQQLQRERDELSDRVASLQSLVGQLRDKEASASQKAKRSLEVVDQAQYDKNQLEMEVRRLKSELERMSDKQREALQESARRVSEAERRYAMQIERLNGDLTAQWDAANRLNLELDRARRTEAELRRELAQKVNTIEELKKELLTKTGSLQNEALTASEERERLESELSAVRLSGERSERQARQETARLQAEVQALRARLDSADQDLLHARKEAIRLNDVIAQLEKELSLSKLTKDSAASKELKRADELTAMVKEMDARHEETKSELEALIKSQTQLMDKLNAECQALTRRLEESSARHKEEMANLQNNIEYLSSKLDAPEHLQNQEWRDDGKLEQFGKQTSRDGKLPVATEKIVTPVKKQLEDDKKPVSYDSPGRKLEVEKLPVTQEIEKDLKPSPSVPKEEIKYVKEDARKMSSDESRKSSIGYKKNEFETNRNVSYDTEQKYEQPPAEYNPQQKTYEPEPGYEKQEYSGQPQEEERYGQDQVYGEQTAGDYDQSQYGYDTGQPYEQSGYDERGYDEGQGYAQGDGGTYETDPYAGGGYESTQVAYDETGYEAGGGGGGSGTTGYQQQQDGDQLYPGTGAYEEHVYTGQGEVYQPEGYEDKSGERYQKTADEPEYPTAYKEKK